MQISNKNNYEIQKTNTNRNTDNKNKHKTKPITTFTPHQTYKTREHKYSSIESLHFKLKESFRANY